MQRRRAWSSRGLATVLIAALLGLTACNTSDRADSAGTSSSQVQGNDPAAGTFGRGCGKIPGAGGGSFQAMATAPVVTAAGANPLLTTLVAALTQAGLVGSLNSSAALTVFAPTDAAFAALPARQLKKAILHPHLLTAVLAHHVVRGQLAPEQLTGDHTTLAGDTLSITGAGEDFSIGRHDHAHILCGGIKTANATIYIIDRVLSPTR